MQLSTMTLVPEAFEVGAPSLIGDETGAKWVPLYHKACKFDPDIFSKVMMNLIRNPNINSSWLFRADILLDQDQRNSDVTAASSSPRPIVAQFTDFVLRRVLVRKLIPRNTLRDQPLDQTCLTYQSNATSEVQRSMVVYKPHVSSQSDMPFYHPRIRGLAFLHEWNASSQQGTVSIHYHFFNNEDSSASKLVRTGLHLLTTVSKHGEGARVGYVKRVQHDTIIPQIPVQTTYARLKERYSRQLIKSWAEVTDPSKHVFEDLGIAAFLIQLWTQMYQNSPFPGFVDIGCGNGLLVHILRREGYLGWGFDARKRKSWENYSEIVTEFGGKPSLRQHVLFPSIAGGKQESDIQDPTLDEIKTDGIVHDGLFPKGTFIISNHADELTPWTPILATISECPFIIIPCCSHDLSGKRFRAPASSIKGKMPSAYSSLVNWVSRIAAECGWKVEKEMLRIPSTRNSALIGRERSGGSGPDVDMQGLIARCGGTEGYADNAMKLVKSAPRGH
ncbi:hypothetical protein F4778DRAFT_765897 [Xylariomycetidae sp. FL2044]|nr:hypothetical protein F4778DRAFT_765878 [Xylariomycetidae sp. FL2044]KAH9883664.1 hypothetical protein F4778DRAFT_765897 [Xylariomycetidae sp. FL2044]